MIPSSMVVRRRRLAALVLALGAVSPACAPGFDQGVVCRTDENCPMGQSCRCNRCVAPGAAEPAECVADAGRAMGGGAAGAAGGSGGGSSGGDAGGAATAGGNTSGGDAGGSAGGEAGGNSAGGAAGGSSTAGGGAGGGSSTGGGTAGGTPTGGGTAGGMSAGGAAPGGGVARPAAPSRSLSLPGSSDFHAATQLSTGRLIIAGTRNLSGSDPRDGLLVAVDGPTASSSLLGGTGNDQLFAIASSQDRYCAGGFTRSFRGTAQGNQAFLVLGTGSGAPQVVRQYSPSDAPLEVRAIIPNGTGWLWGGYHDTSWVVVTMGSTGVATAAQTVSYPAPFTGRQLRAVARQGSLLALAGDLEEGLATRGVVVVLEATSATAYTLRWAQRASGTDYTSFLDVAFDGSDLLVAGLDGANGVLLRMNPNTGTRLTEARVPGWELRTIRSATPPISVGSTDGGLIVGRWTTGAFTGFDLRGLEPVSLRSAVPLFATDAGFRLVAQSGASLADVQLNDALQPSCDGGASGRAQRLSIPSVAGLTFTPLTATVNTVSLLSETLTGTGLGSLQVSAGPVCVP